MRPPLNHNAVMLKEFRRAFNLTLGMWVHATESLGLLYAWLLYFSQFGLSFSEILQKHFRAFIIVWVVVFEAQTYIKKMCGQESPI